MAVTGGGAICSPTTFPDMKNVLNLQEVIGVPDERMGEEICAFVRLHDKSGKIDRDTIKQYCKVLNYWLDPPHLRPTDLHGVPDKLLIFSISNTSSKDMREFFNWFDDVVESEAAEEEAELTTSSEEAEQLSSSEWMEGRERISKRSPLFKAEVSQVISLLVAELRRNKISSASLSSFRVDDRGLTA
ncbi:hypothetical protein EVAR_101564_1 [Eumeta japonica]|uniref:Uncharacterized protein n=1 Tax=Eumeta variegata TaxID=151549 RepID=A0A4C1STT5_EUMVA|nr:hypothetical protein EVAR_101564_1 [Eumeta japonica]